MLTHDSVSSIMLLVRTKQKRGQKMKLGTLDSDVEVCGIAKIDGKWTEIVGETKKDGGITKLVVNGKKYDDQNIEIET
jgi:hypothetical protein